MTQRVSNAGRKKKIRPPLAITLVLSLYVTLIYMYIYVENARGSIGRVTKVVYRCAVLLYRIRSDTTPGPVRLRFSIFVNDTGLNSVHVYVGASSFLCSPLILSFSLSLFLLLYLSLPFVLYYPFLRFCRAFRSALLAITTNTRRSMGYKCASRQADSRPSFTHTYPEARTHTGVESEEKHTHD